MGAKMRTKILAEDKHILVCFKPPGLAVQSGRIGEMDMVSELKNYLASASQNSSYLGLVHRLDQPVSGLLVFAKTPAAAAGLSRQAAREGEADAMEKEYRALVYLQDGAECMQEGARLELTDYLQRDGKQNHSRVVRPDTKGAKRARLEVEMLKKGKEQRHALVSVHLLTGRHHQIRVQLSHAGMPLLGDARYGSAESREYGESLGIRSVCLCACRLCFTHPITGERLEFRTEEMPWKLG